MPSLPKVRAFIPLAFPSQTSLIWVVLAYKGCRRGYELWRSITCHEQLVLIIFCFKKLMPWALFWPCSKFLWYNGWLLWSKKWKMKHWDSCFPLYCFVWVKLKKQWCRYRRSCATWKKQDILVKFGFQLICTWNENRSLPRIRQSPTLSSTSRCLYLIVIAYMFNKAKILDNADVLC